MGTLGQNLASGVKAIGLHLLSNTRVFAQQKLHVFRGPENASGAKTAEIGLVS
jgi:hypothetical protein